MAPWRALHVRWALALQPSTIAFVATAGTHNAPRPAARACPPQTTRFAPRFFVRGRGQSLNSSARSTQQVRITLELALPRFRHAGRKITWDKFVANCRTRGSPSEAQPPAI